MERKEDEEIFDIKRYGNFKQYTAPKDDRFRVGMVSSGHHGDVWPLVTLAKALAQRRYGGKCRYVVRLFVPTNLMQLCKESGVDAVAVFDDTREAVLEAGGHDHTLAARRALNRWLTEGARSAANVLDALDSFQPGLVVVGNLDPQVALSYEKENGIPVISTFFDRTQMEVAVNVWEERLQELARPFVYAMSDMLDTQPYASCVDRVGPLGQMAQEKVGDLPVELQDFLSKGPPPVAAGWGSMLPRSPGASQLLCMLLRALKTKGKRGVILGGWQGLEGLGQELVTKGSLPGMSPDDADLADFARKNVFFAQQLPYESLLPECCCVIHHGGSGVTHTAMRAGCPQIITPVCNDQVLNAERVETAGVGIGLASLASASTRDFSEAIANAVMMDDSARYFSSLVAGEHGEEEVCKLIDIFVKEYLPKAGSLLVPTKPRKKKQQADEFTPKVFDDGFGFQKACSPQPRFKHKEMVAH